MVGGGLAFHQPHHFIAPPNKSEHRPRGREQAPCPPSSLRQLKAMEEFKQAHAQFLKLGLDRDPHHAGELLSACALSGWGSIDYARSIFLVIDEPGTFHFNTMIRAFAKDSDPEAALLLYREMQERGAKPDSFTFPFALKACAQLAGIGEGMQVHGHAAKLGFECDVFVQNSLINMYGKCREIKLSCKVFDQMSYNRTVASWSSLLAAHTRMGLWIECLTLFAAMTTEGLRPDESSMVAALSSCAHLGALGLGRSIHCSLLRSTTGLNVIVQTTLIEMYAKCGYLEKGLAIFDRMSEKNTWAYSVAISGLAMHGDGEEALRIFSNMIDEGLEPDEVVYVGVLSACSGAGLMEEGLRCFDRMRFKHQIAPTHQHYGCMVDLMCRAGRLSEAHELIRSMPTGPTDVAWRCLLSACKVHGDLELAELTSKNLSRLDARNTGDYILLSNMYAKARRWDDMARIRTEMVDRGLAQVPGFSRVEVRGRMHTFVSQDRRHPESDRVYEMLHQMEWQLRFEGYIPDISQVPIDADDEEKGRMLGGHSQKLAIAFALVKTSPRTPIRIVTNLRMCGDCHTYTGLISRIFEREIVVRDRGRFHCFRQGACSCGDYW